MVKEKFVSKIDLFYFVLIYFYFYTTEVIVKTSYLPQIHFCYEK